MEDIFGSSPDPEDFIALNGVGIVSIGAPANGIRLVSFSDGAGGPIWPDGRAYRSRHSPYDVIRRGPGASLEPAPRARNLSELIDRVDELEREFRHRISSLERKVSNP